MNDEPHKPVSPVPTSQPSEEAVVGYLKRHPDFFTKHDALLDQLSLQHDSGAAISLIERQLARLRKRNQLLEKEMLETISIARENERILNCTKKLILDLIITDDLEHALQVIDQTLRNEFNIADVRLRLILPGNPPTIPSILQSNPHFSATRLAVINDVFPGLAHYNQPLLGKLTPEQENFLCPDEKKANRSYAVAPLGQGGHVGLLAIASQDKHHFVNTHGTVFLHYIADIMARVLARHLSCAS